MKVKELIKNISESNYRPCIQCKVNAVSIEGFTHWDGGLKDHINNDSYLCEECRTLNDKHFYENYHGAATDDG